MAKYGNLQISIEYPSRKIDEVNVHRYERYNIDLSSLKKVGEAEFKKIQHDHKRLGMLLSEHPEKMLKILDDVLVGNLKAAKEKARDIGFTEEDFRRESGGLIWWVVIGVAAAILLYPTPAY
jgi:hypothetical protein